jgi:hypothetical protein
MLGEVERDIAKLQRVADALRGSTSKRSRAPGKRSLKPGCNGESNYKRLDT